MSDVDAVRRPARGYSWEPFKPGNLDHRTHGTRSERLVLAKTAELVEAGHVPDVDQVREALPWSSPIDVFAIEAWQRAEARVVMLGEHLEQVGLVDAGGLVREGLVNLLIKLERNAAECRDRLGLDPTSRSRLLRDQASAAASGTAALDRIAAAGRAARERREALDRGETTVNPSPPGPTPESVTEPPVRAEPTELLS